MKVYPTMAIGAATCTPAMCWIWWYWAMVIPP
jgi:hypothetical protein